ncbi:YgcG family protein [Lampropedia puyangensis]|uniref:YgcG family protein n=1 Tax=Lampropedia puyangensis TaxID=1330072 RepID=A0A4S8FB66_9BURK|nr:TPM domain-containing protein [Lampropedia puyangensis]THU03754.1 YgcG family protein [Lampropedia puyangensis]
MGRVAVCRLRPLQCAGVLRALGACVVGVVLSLLLGLAHAQVGLQPVPALTAQVIDQTGTLTQSQRQQITAQLEAIEQQHGSQVVVLMVPTTTPEDIAAYANRVASAWKIGRKEVGDGLLFIIAKNDRTLRLEVARSLEGTIPDIAAGRIIQDSVVPQLRSGDFAAAIEAGLHAIEARLAGDEWLPAPAPKATASAERGFESMVPESLWPMLFFGVPIVCNVLARLIGRFFTMLLIGGVVGAGTLVMTRSWPEALLYGGVAGFVALIVSAGPSGRLSGGRSSSGGYSSGRSGGWSSGGSSGGFRSGGGGSFGGGGASGKW